jgi:hypothetical protein
MNVKEKSNRVRKKKQKKEKKRKKKREKKTAASIPSKQTQLKSADIQVISLAIKGS